MGSEMDISDGLLPALQRSQKALVLTPMQTVMQSARALIESRRHRYRTVRAGALEVDSLPPGQETGRASSGATRPLNWEYPFFLLDAIELKV